MWVCMLMWDSHILVTQLWKEMSHSSRSPSNPAACPASSCNRMLELLSSPTSELFPGLPSLSSPRRSCASCGSWQYESFGRQLGGSERLHTCYWKHSFALVPETRQTFAELGCEKSPQQGKILLMPFLCAKKKCFFTDFMYGVKFFIYLPKSTHLPSLLNHSLKVCNMPC